MREYRITRPEKYTKGPGLKDLSARRGFFIEADTPGLARECFRKLYRIPDQEPLDVEEHTQDGWRLAVTRDAQTKVTTYDDSEFKRTALVIQSDNQGSIDILDATGKRVAQLNIFLTADECLIVDTIDVEDMWDERMVLTFRGPTDRERILKAGKVNSVDFRKTTKETP